MKFCLALCDDEQMDEQLTVRTDALKSMLRKRTLHNVAHSVEVVLSNLLGDEIDVVTGVEEGDKGVVIRVTCNGTERQYLFNLDSEVLITDRRAPARNSKQQEDFDS